MCKNERGRGDASDYWVEADEFDGTCAICGEEAEWSSDEPEMVSGGFTEYFFCAQCDITIEVIHDLRAGEHPFI